MHLAEIQKLTDTAPEELTEDDVVEVSASEPVPDDEEEGVRAAEQTDTGDLTEGSDRARLPLASFTARTLL